MRKFGIALAMSAMLALAAAGPALSQQQSTDPLAAAGLKTYRNCLTAQRGQPAECACVAGYYSAAVPLDSLQILSAVSAFIGPNGEVDNMQGAQAAAMAERDRLGMSQPRFAEIMGSFANLGPIGEAADKVCMAVQAEAAK